MAVFKFTPDDSVLIPAGAPAGTAAFSDDKAGADSLIVDTSAFLISLATNGRGANLANTKAWTVTINGSVFSDDAEGLFLAADNAEKSAITINGSVRGDEHGIFAGSKVDIVNDGDIFGEKNGITLTDSAPIRSPTLVTSPGV